MAGSGAVPATGELSSHIDTFLADQVRAPDTVDRSAGRGRGRTSLGPRGRRLTQLPSAGAAFPEEHAVATNSSIEWTEVTWNPVTGCDRVAAGCDNCYALALAKRLKAMGVEKYQNDGDPRTSGPGFGVTVHPAALDQPRKWRSPKVVFVNSMSDLFHATRPDRLHPRRLRRHGRDAAAHLPGPHQARLTAGARSPTSSTGRTTSGWACRSSRSTPSTGSTTCAPHRPRCGSCPASRSSPRCPQ